MNGMVNAREIKNIAKNVIDRGYDFEYVGLRVQSSTYGLVVGDEITHKSNHWCDGEILPETVGGICAVSAEQAASRNLSFGAYEGNTVLVLGSNAAQYGDDDGEIVMQKLRDCHPVILDIISVE